MVVRLLLEVREQNKGLEVGPRTGVANPLGVEGHLVETREEPQGALLEEALPHLGLLVHLARLVYPLV